MEKKINKKETEKKIMEKRKFNEKEREKNCEQTKIDWQRKGDY